MIEIATILFFLGLVLIIGPTILGFIFSCCAIINPGSSYVTFYLMLTIVANILIDNRCRIELVKSIRKKSSVDQRKMANKVYRKFLKIVKVTHIVSILSIFIISFNDMFVNLRDYWMNMLREKSEFFVILLFVGTILVSISIGFFVGVKFIINAKKRRASIKVEIVDNFKSESKKKTEFVEAEFEDIS